MQKKLKLAVLALCSSSMVVAQNTDTKTSQQAQTPTLWMNRRSPSLKRS